MSKLFKNKVGRPSNETKNLRKVFVISIVAIVISTFTILISLLSNSGILSGNLKGATSYTVSYSIYNQNNGDVTIKSYPNYKTHTGKVSFPQAPSYTVKSGKACSFKGWIFQETANGRYRMLTTGGSYVWYRDSLDKGKYSIARYVFFNPGETFKISSNVKLYAAFDCKSTGSNITTKATNNTIKIEYQKNSSYATGSMSAKTVSKNGTINLDKENFNFEGHYFYGWKAYRYISGAKKYFVKGKGWTAASASSGTLIANNSSLSAEYNIANYTGAGNTIYMEAQWRELSGKSNYYTIVYNKNGGSGSMSNQEIKKATNGGTNLTKNSYSRSGYTFNGWKAYRYINGTKKYFVKGSGWTATSAGNGTTISNSADIQKNNDLNIDNYTSTGKYIFLEAQWKSSASISYSNISSMVKTGDTIDLNINELYGSFTITSSGATIKSISTSNDDIALVKLQKNESDYKKTYRLHGINLGSTNLNITLSNGVSYKLTVRINGSYPTDSYMTGNFKTKTTNGVTVYYQSSCNSNTINAYNSALGKLPSYITKNAKRIYYLTDSNYKTVFNKIAKEWGLSTTAGTSRGSTFIPSKTNGKYNPQFIILKCTNVWDSSRSPSLQYDDIAHEFAHAMYYNFAKASGTTPLSNGGTYDAGAIYTPNGGKSFAVYYNTAKSSYKSSILNSYAYSSLEEFMAETYASYFMNKYYNTTKISGPLSNSYINLKTHMNDLLPRIQNTLGN